jgi:hypothetical protein
MLMANGIADVPTTVKNPMSNGICERSHLSIANHLHTLLVTQSIQTITEATCLLDICLAAASYAIHATIHQTLQATPGSLFFR